MARSLAQFLDVVGLGVAGGLFAFYASRGVPGTWLFSGLAAVLAVNLLALSRRSSSSSPTDRK